MCTSCIYYPMLWRDPYYSTDCTSFSDLPISRSSTSPTVRSSWLVSPLESIPKVSSAASYMKSVVMTCLAPGLVDCRCFARWKLWFHSDNNYHYRSWLSRVYHSSCQRLYWRCYFCSKLFTVDTEVALVSLSAAIRGAEEVIDLVRRLFFRFRLAWYFPGSTCCSSSCKG